MIAYRCPQRHPKSTPSDVAPKKAKAKARRPRLVHLGGCSWCTLVAAGQRRDKSRFSICRFSNRTIRGMIRRASEHQSSVYTDGSATSTQTPVLPLPLFALLCAASGRSAHNPHPLLLICVQGLHQPRFDGPNAQRHRKPSQGRARMGRPSPRWASSTASAIARPVAAAPLPLNH